jgi:hypothetical protein
VACAGGVGDGMEHLLRLRQDSLTETTPQLQPVMLDIRTRNGDPFLTMEVSGRHASVVSDVSFLCPRTVDEADNRSPD